MKCISLWNPWACLMAYGTRPQQKRIETRSWPTKHRGLLAIHCAKTFPREADALCAQPGPIHDALRAIIARNRDAVANSPGHVIGVGKLIDCVRVPELYPVQLADGRTIPPAEPERSFGDFTPGRFGWVFEWVRPLATPVRFRGAQMLFEVPDELVGEVAGG